jgi:hypothetical protein
MQALSIDIETKVLNDLEDKLDRIVENAIARPEVGEILDKEVGNLSPKEPFAVYVLCICAHAFHMHQRGVLRENEWVGWQRSIRASFREGTLGDHWRSVKPENWFDPEFVDFIDNEILRREKLAVKTELARRRGRGACCELLRCN